jgi:hypothetical protein
MHLHGNDKGAIDVRLSTAVNDGIELIVADDCCGMTLQVKRQAFDRSSLLIATRAPQDSVRISSTIF